MEVITKVLAGTVCVKLLFLADKCEELSFNMHLALASSNPSRSLYPYNLAFTSQSLLNCLSKASDDQLRENWMAPLPAGPSLASQHHLREFRVAGEVTLWHWAEPSSGGGMYWSPGNHEGSLRPAIFIFLYNHWPRLSPLTRLKSGSSEPSLCGPELGLCP